jgi:DNA-directed RNA polymerase II subunit RPB1
MCRGSSSKQQQGLHQPLPPPLPAPCSCEDDLTHKLVEIVRANTTLRRMIANGSPQHIVQEYVALLQYHITTYMDNTLPGVNPATQRSGRPIKSISQVWKLEDEARGVTESDKGHDD